MSLKITKYFNDSILLIENKRYSDNRGYFSEIYNKEIFNKFPINVEFVQDNISFSRNEGTLRGLHFQNPPFAQGKLVRVIKGSVLDVAVDIRRTSPTFLQWHGEILSAANRKSLLIPEGYAHGFQALTEDCELIYLHTSAYHPDAEGALNVTDPALSIDWPLPVIDLSKRDQNHPFVTNINFKGITL